jgi:glycosyltransferase 2 family protein
VDEQTKHRRRRRLLLSTGAGLGVSALFGWLALKDVDWDTAHRVFSAPRWGWVALYVGAIVFIQGVRILRWWLLLHALGEGRLGRTFAVGAVGLSAIFFLPARLGELARPVLTDGDHIGFAEVSATVVLERLVDGVFVGLLILGVGFWVQDSLPNAGTIRVAGLLFGLAFLTAATGVFLAARFSTRWTRWVSRLLRRWPRLAERVNGVILRFEPALYVLVRSGRMGSYLALTGVIWVVNGASMILMFEALDLPLGARASFVLLGALAVGVLVPAGPTAIGTFHFAVMWATGLYGIGTAAAFEFAVALHLAQVAGNLLVGVAGLLGGGLSRSRPEHRAATTEGSPHG